MILTPEDLARCQAIVEVEVVDIRQIVNAVAEATSIPAWVIYSKKRDKKFAHARQLVYYLAHRHGMSFSAIGRAMRRDHTTVMHGVKCEELRRYPQGNPQRNPQAIKGCK